MPCTVMAFEYDWLWRCSHKMVFKLRNALHCGVKHYDNIHTRRIGPFVVRFMVGGWWSDHWSRANSCTNWFRLAASNLIAQTILWEAVAHKLLMIIRRPTLRRGFEIAFGRKRKLSPIRCIVDIEYCRDAFNDEASPYAISADVVDQCFKLYLGCNSSGSRGSNSKGSSRRRNGGNVLYSVWLAVWYNECRSWSELRMSLSMQLLPCVADVAFMLFTWLMRNWSWNSKSSEIVDTACYGP